MIRIVIAALLLVAQQAWAQHSDHGINQMSGVAAAEGHASTLPRETGQSAFAAIAEIVAMLEADPATDWSKVNIGALRAHLIDMDNVTSRAHVVASEIPGGARYVVEGDGDVRDSIRRMTGSHAGMTKEDPHTLTAVSEIPTGVVMTVTSKDPSWVQRIRALGFFGAMTSGVHHQLHHLMIARGEMHH